MARPITRLMDHLDFYHPAEMYIYIGSQGSRYTNTCIKENGYSSVNIPSEEQMQKTDYVGLVSGRDTDKSTYLIRFSVL